MIGVKCTDKERRRKRGAPARRRRRQKRLICRMCFLLFVLCVAAAGLWYSKHARQETEPALAAEYEALHYDGAVYEGELYSAGLCVAQEDVYLDDTPDTSHFKAAALFNEETHETEFAYQIHDRAYPASLTKLMTALVAIRYADVDEVVTVPAEADASTFAVDEQTCGIKEGDQLTIKDLLYGLLLYSGNDNAVAVADCVAGNIEDFADMMNEEAARIMARDSHFVNPSGLHDDNHYTTAYDLYLIFHECLKSDLFVQIISSDSYTANVTGADGTVREITWEPTSYYALGDAPLPSTGTIIGGKTGTTLKAGNCLLLYVKSDAGEPYIAIVMGADTKDILYRDMTKLVESIPSANAGDGTQDTDEEGE